jgi:hypothetical protein
MLNAWPLSGPARVVLLAMDPHLIPNEISRKFRQTIDLIFRPATFNRELDDAL